MPVDPAGLSVPDFQYEALNADLQEVRLVRVESPSDFDDDAELIITMSTLSLKNNPPVFALSYAWGEPQKVHPIICNGRRLLLTASLGRALRLVFAAVSSNSTPLYRRGEDIYLWADGICINQDDKVEKSTQILLMRDIYRKAKGVIAYIGTPKDSDPDKAFQAYALLYGVSVPKGGEKGELFVPKEPDFDPDALRQLWEQPWFGRSWVMQEMALADTILCIYGHERKYVTWMLEHYMSLVTTPVAAATTWERNIYLSKWREQRREQKNQSPITNDTVCRFRLTGLNTETWRSLRRELEQNCSGLDPILTLSQSRRAEASDPRDKIYSMIGLFTEDFAKGLTIDYSNSNTAVKTFVSFAEHCIRYDLGMQLLEQAGLAQDLKDLPSWVPNWTIEPRCQPSFCYKWYKSAGSTKINIAVVDWPSRAISASGWVVGKVCQLGLAYSYSNHFSPIPQYPEVKTASAAVAVLETNAYLWCKMLGDPEFRCFGEEDFKDVIWRILWLDTDMVGNRAKPSDRKYHQAWLERYPRQANEAVVGPVAGDEHGDAATFRTGVLSMEGRRLCLVVGYGTTRIGALPEETLCDDLIVVLQGGRTPFVLRPLPETEEYRLVGPAYVHGIMYGELFEDNSVTYQPSGCSNLKRFVIV